MSTVPKGAFGLTPTLRQAQLVIQELIESGGNSAATYDRIERELDLASTSRAYKIVSALVARRWLFRSAEGLIVLRRLQPDPDLVFLRTFRHAGLETDAARARAYFAELDRRSA